MGHLEPISASRIVPTEFPTRIPKLPNPVPASLFFAIYFGQTQRAKLSEPQTSWQPVEVALREELRAYERQLGTDTLNGDGDDIESQSAHLLSLMECETRFELATGLTASTRHSLIARGLGNSPCD